MGMQAPPLRANLDWINVDPGPSLEDLRGRLVLLHFWHPAATECIRSLELVRAVHKRLDEQVYPICVHTPRYPGHCDRGAAIRAVARQHVYHPTIHDPAFQVWHDFEVNAWPTRRAD